MPEKRINSERPHPIKSFTLSPESSAILEQASRVKKASRSSIVDNLIREHLSDVVDVVAA